MFENKSIPEGVRLLYKLNVDSFESKASYTTETEFVPNKMFGVPRETRTPTKGFGDPRAAITPARHELVDRDGFEPS